MKLVSWLFLSGLLFAGLPLVGQAHCHTRWEVDNRTGSALRIECVSDHDPALGMRSPDTINSQSSWVHCWGDGHYNDGMGLEAGAWTCAVGLGPHPLSAPGAALFHFQTLWMENVALIVEEKDGAVVVRKETQLR